MPQMMTPMQWWYLQQLANVGNTAFPTTPGAAYYSRLAASDLAAGQRAGMWDSRGVAPGPTATPIDPNADPNALSSPDLPPISPDQTTTAPDVTPTPAETPLPTATPTPSFTPIPGAFPSGSATPGSSDVFVNSNYDYSASNPFYDGTNPYPIVATPTDTPPAAAPSALPSPSDISTYPDQTVYAPGSNIPTDQQYIYPTDPNQYQPPALDVTSGANIPIVETGVVPIGPNDYLTSAGANVPTNETMLPTDPNLYQPASTPDVLPATSATPADVAAQTPVAPATAATPSEIAAQTPLANVPATSGPPYEAPAPVYYPDGQGGYTPINYGYGPGAGPIGGSGPTSPTYTGANVSFPSGWSNQGGGATLSDTFGGILGLHTPAFLAWLHANYPGMNVSDYEMAINSRQGHQISPQAASGGVSYHGGGAIPGAQ